MTDTVEVRSEPSALSRLFQYSIIKGLTDQSTETRKAIRVLAASISHSNESSPGRSMDSRDSVRSKRRSTNVSVHHSSAVGSTPASGGTHIRKVVPGSSAEPRGSRLLLIAVLMIRGYVRLALMSYIMLLAQRSKRKTEVALGQDVLKLAKFSKKDQNPVDYNSTLFFPTRSQNDNSNHGEKSPRSN